MSLSITRSYSSGNTLTKAQLDAAFDAIETKFNSTLILGSELGTGAVGTTNIAASAVTTAKINDGAVTGSKRVLTVTAKTTTYTATASDEFIACDTSGGAWTLTLPAAASSSGKVYKIKKTSNDFTALTIDGNASETIDGATTTTLNTQYEQLEIVCDGSNWHIVERRVPSVWTAYTPTGAWVANTTYTGFWRRVGDSLEVSASVVVSGAPTAATFTLTVPSGLVVDTAKLPSTSQLTTLGVVDVRDDSAAIVYPGLVRYASTTTVNAFAAGSTTTSNLTAVGQTVPFTFANLDTVKLRFSVPITGWNG